MKFIQELKLQAFLKEDKENSILNCGLWYSEINQCEQRDKECITTHGIYFGTTDNTEPKFCPLHFFKDSAYTLEPTNIKKIIELHNQKNDNAILGDMLN